MRPIYLLSIGLLISVQASWGLEQSVTEDNCSDANVMVIKNKEKSGELRSKSSSRALPPAIPAFLEGWEFLGLTKESMLEKIDSINKLARKSDPLWKLDEKQTVLEGNSELYVFEFTANKITRVRISHFSTHFGYRDFRAVEDRKKELSYAIEKTSRFLNYLHTGLEKHERNDLTGTAFPEFSQNDVLTLDYSRLRSFYVRRAGLLKEAGLDSAADEAAAIAYDEKFERSLSNLTAEEKKRILKE